MGDLPYARVAAFNRPFTYTGVDCFGPMNIKTGRRQEKRYGVLFTCLTMRAIHIELAYSLSTDSFIISLRNFMCRRGQPAEIWCDNGTNFHGSENELKRALSLMNEELQNQFMNIKWRFNPPSAPHMGGAWERMIRCVKSNMMAVLPVRTPNEELLRGCLCEIENIVNSRPLTYIPVDADAPEALTPNHFLLGSSSGMKPVGEFSDNVLFLRRCWKISQQVAEHFWRRWVREVAPTITRRTKWFDKVKPITAGDVVIIVHERSTRNHWPMGRVEEVITGNDGQVRQAVVRTQHGIYRRPTAKIAVLDVK